MKTSRARVKGHKSTVRGHAGDGGHGALDRRAFVKVAGVSAAGVLMSGLPGGWVGSAYADEGPETRTMRFGIIALTDCAPIVMAHELGLFRKFGITSIVSKEASWAVIRDKLSLGENHATHMLIGMPLASTMGLAGSPVKPMVIPWLLNRNGQAITLNNRLKQAGVRTPKQLKPLADKARASGRPLTFAMTFPTGTHAMWTRYWLASGGIHPDKDVSLITIPPAQMVANMRVDKMDGFCVGEPWNKRALDDGIGFTAVTTQQMWKDHPEKVCAFTEEFAAKNPRSVKAALKALHLASVELDKMENRMKFAEVIARPTYINCPPAIIQERLMGKYDYGDGRVEQDPNYMIFSNRACNYPQRMYATCWLTQFRRWGMTKGAPDYAGIPKRVMRPDLYLDAMKELGVAPKVVEEQSITLFDGAFDGKDPEKYARSFPVNGVVG
jgi:nitrate/nitrite transport system substrate-binding protein